MMSQLVTALPVNCGAAGQMKLRGNDSGTVWSDGAGLELHLSWRESVRDSIAERVFSPVLKPLKNLDGIVDLAVYGFAVEAGGPMRLLRFGLNMPGDPAGFYGVGPEGFSPRLDPQDSAFASEDAGKCRISSNSLFAFKADGTEEITLIGALSFAETEGTIEFEYDKASGTAGIIYKMILDGISLAAGEQRKLDCFTVITGTDLNRLLREWAELAARGRGARIPAAPPTGWNDWQYYRNEKTAKDVLDSAEVVAELKRRGYPLAFIQVDGGFCAHLSEWSCVKPGFAPGMRELSEKILGMGLRFGLWFAPYIQNVETSVVRSHPEWLLRDSAGQPVVLGSSNVGRSCLIDYTVPGTEQWLREQLRLFVKEWRVEWLKLDGPNSALYRLGRLRDRSETVTGMLNRTFEIIREEAGPDVLIEGEGMMGPALGKVDIHRVQTDNHPTWYGNNDRRDAYAPRVYGKELLMGFLHRRWWCNHRENVILRNWPSEFCHDAARNPHAVEAHFSEPEFRTQLTAAVMGSGGLLLTDPMRELIRDRERFDWISRLLPVHDRAAEMVDAFPGGRYSSIYRLPADGDLFFYSFTNWEDRMADFECPLPDASEYHAFSVFERRMLGGFRGRLKVSGLAAHDSRIIALRKKKSVPQLAATDLRLLPGTEEVKNLRVRKDVLSFEICHFRQDDARLFLAGNGHRIEKIETNAVRFSVDGFDAEYPVIRFEGLRQNTFFRIRWSPCHES
ncbi:MAG: Melibiase [Lentisphaerae bacterium ADurb.Bin242]|nr:MAG: Melibiase [Lentisphaerae bacterium ADurb.Bin242]